MRSCGKALCRDAADLLSPVGRHGLPRAQAGTWRQGGLQWSGLVLAAGPSAAVAGVELDEQDDGDDGVDERWESLAHAPSFGATTGPHRRD